MKRQLLALLVILLISSNFSKAENYNLDLENSIAIAKHKSFTMRNLALDFKIAEQNLRSATSRFKTHINMNFTLPQYTETVRQDQDSSGILFYPMKQLYYRGQVEVTQPLPTDGHLFLTSGLNNYDDLYSSFRTTNTFARLGFVQPINAFYGYNSIRSSFRQAKLAYERSEKEMKRAELNLIYEVSSSFYGLLSYQKEAEIAKLNLERQTEAFEIATNKYQAGLIKEVDALQMEVDLAEAQNSYDMSLASQNSALLSFKRLIGIDLQDSVTVSSEFQYQPVLVDTDKAVEMALQNRLEIREQEIRIELDKMNLKRQKAEGMIKGSLTGHFEKIGVSGQHLDTHFGTAVKHSYNNLIDRPQNFGFGFTITVPILDWGENKALVRAAEARLEQNELQREEIRRNIEQEVRNLVSNLTSSLKRLQLLEKNVSVAEKSFEITRQRFSDGDIDSQSLALERNRLNNAYVSHLKAYINYQMQLADLMRRTFYDFKNNREVL